MATKDEYFSFNLKTGFLLAICFCTATWLGYMFIFGYQSVENKRYDSKNHAVRIKAHDYQDTNLTRFDVGKAKITFLPNFKSHCFLEKLPDDPKLNIYSENAYVKVEGYRNRNNYGGAVENMMDTNPQGVQIEDEFNICNSKGKCRVRCLPYFMLLGMAKSGTSDFFGRIKSHPFVLSGAKKELFYWTQFRFQINASIGDYADLFDKALSKFVDNPIVNQLGETYYPYMLGDFTSVTFTDDVFWRENHEDNSLPEPKHLKMHDLYGAIPSIKLIVILRNPTTRLYSSYNMYRRKNNLEANPKDFHIRVLKSIEWWHNCTVLKGLPKRNCVYGSPPEMPPVVGVLRGLKDNNRWFGPVNVANYSGEIRRGMYSIFAKDWLSVFPKEQMLFLKTEEYSVNPKQYFQNIIFPFLEIPWGDSEDNTRISSEGVRNSASYKPMLPKTKVLLDDFYEPFNKELADFMGDDKWLWK